MQSVNKLINKEIIKQIFRNVGWIAIVYQLALLVAIPLEYYNAVKLFRNSVYVGSSGVVEERFFELGSLFEIGYFKQSLIFGIVPIILSIFLFRYLMTKKSIDFAHSNPVTRKSYYLHYILTGIAILIVPILIATMVLFLTQLGLGEFGGMHFSEYLKWIAESSIRGLFGFSLGVLVATITGNSIVQGLITYTIFVIPPIVISAIAYFMSLVVKGFPTEDSLHSLDYQRTVWLLDIMRVDFKLALSKPALIVYLGVSIMLLFVGYFFYKKRKSEKASSSFVFKFIQPIFKYSLTISAMILGGIYFVETRSQSWTLLIVGLFIGSICGYFIAEVILQKTWRVFSRMKGYGGFVAVTIILSVAVKLFLPIYENKIPSVSEVEKVYCSDSYFEDVETQGIRAEMENEIHTYTDPESIKAVQQLHQKAIDVDSPKLEGYRNLYINYYLKDGSQLRREYLVMDTQLEDIPEFQENVDRFFDEKVENLSAIWFLAGQKETTITDAEELKELVAAYKLDAKNEKWLQPESTITMSMTIKDSLLYLEIGLRDTHTIKWLEDNGYQNVTDELRAMNHLKNQ